MYLGIDPGIRKLGYALINPDRTIVDAWVLLLEVKSPTRMDQFARMHEIYEFFDKMIKKQPIRWVAIEKLYFTHSNQSNAEFVYGVRGALAMLFRKHTIPIHEWTPQELKKYITGSWTASKDAMQRMIVKLYQLEETPKRHDTSDALWLARLLSR